MDQAQALWDRTTPVVIGVSGGSDSMALLALMAAVEPHWPTERVPVHVDHGLRPESGDDADWVVRTVADRFSLAVRVFRPAVIPEAGESLEMAARRVRYGVLHAVRASLGSRALVAVAHQQDDQAETVLMRILQGTGVEGLAAMQPIRGAVVRPLLTFSRQELRAYLAARQLPWREDPSNQDLHPVRNRIRHVVVPTLREWVNPQVERALTGLADRARDTMDVVRWAADLFVSRHDLNWDREPLTWPPDFQQLPKAVRAHLFLQYGMRRHLRLEARHIARALEGHANWPEGYQVTRQADGSVRIGRREAGEPDPGSDRVRPLLEGANPVDGGVVWMVVSPSLPADGGLSGRTYVNRGRWPRLGIRRRRAGDVMRPMGLGGAKKLQDIFVDRKVPRGERAAWPVVVGGWEDDAPVLAVVGLATGEEARTGPGDSCYEIWYDRTVTSP